MSTTEMSNHHHEDWQVQKSAKGGYYCAACGVDVTRDEGSGYWVTKMAPSVIDAVPAVLRDILEHIDREVARVSAAERNTLHTVPGSIAQLQFRERREGLLFVRTYIEEALR